MAKRKAGKGKGRPSSATSSASSERSVVAYSFAGKTGDEAQEEFARAARRLRDAFKARDEHPFVTLRVRQLDFEYHDFLITLPKTATIYRLQREISAQQHLGSIFPSDIIVYRCPPEPDSQPANNVGLGGGDASASSDSANKRPGTKELICSGNPMARLMDVIPEVASFETTKDDGAVEADPPPIKSAYKLLTTTTTSTTEDGATVTTTVIAQPSSKISLVHDMTPGPHTGPSTQSFAGLSSAGGGGAFAKVALRKDQSASQNQNDSDQDRPLGGNYISVHYDVHSYTKLIPIKLPPTTTTTTTATPQPPPSSPPRQQRSRSVLSSAGSRTLPSRPATSTPRPLTNLENTESRSAETLATFGFSSKAQSRIKIPAIIKGLDRSCSILTLDQLFRHGATRPSSSSSSSSASKTPKLSAPVMKMNSLSAHHPSVTNVSSRSASVMLQLGVPCVMPSSRRASGLALTAGVGVPPSLGIPVVDESSELVSQVLVETA